MCKVYVMQKERITLIKAFWGSKVMAAIMSQSKRSGNRYINSEWTYFNILDRIARANEKSTKRYWWSRCVILKLIIFIQSGIVHMYMQNILINCVNIKFS